MALLDPAVSDTRSRFAGTIALPHRRRWFPFGVIQQSRERAVAAKRSQRSASDAATPPTRWTCSRAVTSKKWW